MLTKNKEIYIIHPRDGYMYAYCEKTKYLSASLVKSFNKFGRCCTAKMSHSIGTYLHTDIERTTHKFHEVGVNYHLQQVATIPDKKLPIW
mgnify:CR=1 FL=1